MGTIKHSKGLLIIMDFMNLLAIEQITQQKEIFFFNLLKKDWKEAKSLQHVANMMKK